MRTINNAAYNDAQATNESSRSVRTFKDLDLYFTQLIMNFLIRIKDWNFIIYPIFFLYMIIEI